MKTVFYFLAFQLLLAPFVLVHAQTPTGNSGTGGTPTGGSGGVQIPNPLRVGTITELFTALLDIVIIFAIPIVAFFIIYAGFLYVTARGNTEQVGQAHRALLYAVIGGVLILGANVLITVIQGTVDSVRAGG